MKRREFITLLGGAAAWPIAAQAEQQPERTRRIGVLMNLAADDAESQRPMKAFVQQLQDLKWIDGRKVQIETCWGAGDADRIRRYAAELVALGPDVILAVGSTTTGPSLQATRTIPVVFAQVIDPVGGGFVESLARPGGNTTGFTQFEYGLGGKWLELLKQIAPGIARAAVIRDFRPLTSGTAQWAAIQVVAPSLGVELSPIGVHNGGEIDRAISAFARGSNAGLIVTSSTLAIGHRQRIIELGGPTPAACSLSLRLLRDRWGPHLLRAGPGRLIPPSSRLCRSCPQRREACRPAGQAPTKFELVDQPQDRESARPEVPPTLLALADEVIE